ncbi:hypothetical protein PRIC2_004222 [Phytophthora ramorum]
MATSSPLAASLPRSPPPSAPTGSGKDLKKPFKIRAELLAPTRLAPKSQLLQHTRFLSIQVIAHEVLLMVLACTKCFAAAGNQPPRIGIVGGGSVGTTVVMTLLANGYRAEQIALSTRQPDRIPRCEALKAPSALPMFQLVPRYYDNARLARESDVLVLCMPPSQLKSVVIQIRHALAANSDAPPLVPDVSKIASHWREGQEKQNDMKEPESISPSRAQTSLDSAFEHGVTLQSAPASRDLEPLSLRLAVEALAPNRDDVCNILQAFSLFCRRAWSQDDRLDALGHVLFGDKSEAVMAALGHAADESEQPNQLQQHEEGRARTPLVVPSWPVEWEQDLVLLQAQLAANAMNSHLGV